MFTSEFQPILGLIIGVILLISLVLKTKVHAFLALIIAASVAGIIGGLAPLEVSGTISDGFGNTLGSIGIVIGFGVMMGAILESSGAAETLAYTLIKVVGRKKEEWAMAIAGFIISIPIFVDSAFVILTPLVKSLSRKTGKSVVGIGVALASGLVITHSMVPPTPGPLGVAGIFGVDIGQMILLGLLLALPMMIVAIIYSKYIGKKIYQLPEEDSETGYYRPEVEKSYPEVIKDIEDRERDLPGIAVSTAPIFVPIVLIFISTTFNALGLTGGFYDFLAFLGAPIIAVGIGLLLAIYLLTGDVSKDDTLNKMEEGMKSAGIILLVTGAGGALGEVIRASGAGDVIATQVADLPIPVLLIPFFISSIMRLIQGSGTVSMITAASISAPILMTLDVNMALAAQAAAAGSLVFSYFNDSFFWVVNRMLGIREVKEQIQVWSVPTTLMWLVGFVEILLLSLFF